MTASETKKKKVRPQPQPAISTFWKNFVSSEPSRATSIFPESLYSSVLPTHACPDSIISSSHNAAASYEAAAQECRDLVARIVKECKRTNEKFTDAEFDIDSDFRSGKKFCLKGLLYKEEKKEKEDGKGQEGPGKDCSSDKEPKAVHRVPWIFKKPQFTVGGYEGTGVRQGKNGVCWWLAAVATLCSLDGVMDKVCVARDEKCGVYGFVFYRDGEWVSTVVDDYLYLKNADYGMQYYDPKGIDGKRWRANHQSGSDGLFFSRCENQNETWLPILEKAYAKVHGDFEVLDGGWMGEAVEDMTGGVTTVVRTDDLLDPDELWKDLSCQNKEFLWSACSKSSGEDTEPWKHGITLCHAFSILKAVEEKGEHGESVRLVKIRNPWGKKDYYGGGEWDGRWSDASEEWTPYWMEKLKHRFGSDGVFWMEYEDMLQQFESIDRTRLFNSEWQVIQKWTSVDVAWVNGYLREKFTIEVKTKGPHVIVLSQLDDRYFKGLQGQYWFNLQYILREKDSQASDFIVRVRCPWRQRSVSAEVELEPGTYEVIPMITGHRNLKLDLVEDVVKKYAEKKPQKLRQIGTNHDVAFAKGVVPIEEAAKEEEEKEEVCATCGNVKESEEKAEDEKSEDKKSEEKKSEDKTSKGDASAEEKSEAKEADGSETQNDNVKDKEDEKKSDEGANTTTTKDEKKSDEKAEDAENKNDEKRADEKISDDATKADNEAEKKDADKDSKTDEQATSSNSEEDSKTKEEANDEFDNKSDGKSEEWEKISQDTKEDGETSKQEKGEEKPSKSQPSTPMARRLTRSPQSRASRRCCPVGVKASSSSSSETTEDTAEEDVVESPWNAVCVVGLRVYTKDAETKVTIGEAVDSESQDLQEVGETAGATV